MKLYRNSSHGKKGPKKYGKRNHGDEKSIATSKSNKRDTLGGKGAECFADALIEQKKDFSKFFIKKDNVGSEESVRSLSNDDGTLLSVEKKLRRKFTLRS